MLKVCTDQDILQKYLIKSDFYEREFGKVNVSASEKEYLEECESLSQITQLPILGDQVEVYI